MNDQSAIDEFIAWGKERAFEFGNDVGTQLWHSLPQIEEADVIGIGECDHYVSERLDVRLALADVLVPGGFYSFGFERGVSDGFRIDRFLRTASIKWLDRVGALRYGVPSKNGSEHRFTFLNKIGDWNRFNRNRPQVRCDVLRAPRLSGSHTGEIGVEDGLKVVVS